MSGPALLEARPVILDPSTGRPHDVAEEIEREHRERRLILEGREFMELPLREQLRRRGFEKVVRDLEKADQFPDFLNTRQGFESLVGGAGEGTWADLTAVTATTETALWTPSAQLCGIPVADMDPGDVYTLRAGGIITTTTANGTITPRLGTTTGGVALGASAATALTGSITNGGWSLTATLFVRAIGTAASTVTCVCTGSFAMASASISFGGTTITTGDNSIVTSIFLGWAFSAASQSITPKYAILSKLN